MENFIFCAVSDHLTAIIHDSFDGGGMYKAGNIFFTIDIHETNSMAEKTYLCERKKIFFLINTLTSQLRRSIAASSRNIF